MTLAPFEPAGEQARWKTLYEILTEVDIDGVVTYDELAEALDLDPVEDRHAVQMAMRRAAKELSEVDLRSVAPVRGKGYRVVQPREQLELAEEHRAKAANSLKRGRDQVVNVNFANMDPEARKAFEIMAHGFAMQMDFNRRIEKRMRNVEDAVKATVQQSDATADDIAELRERLAKFEERLGDQ